MRVLRLRRGVSCHTANVYVLCVRGATDEMRKVIEQTNKLASNQEAGESGDDFFNTLDRDGDGEVDKEEAKAFFEAALGGAGGGKKDEL